MHAVRILGWGHENNTDFWILANSYGREWGENGLARIKRETCNIEHTIIGLQPDLKKSLGVLKASKYFLTRKVSESVRPFRHFPSKPCGCFNF